MGRNSDIRICNTPGDLALAAAEFITELAKQAVIDRGRFVIALSGGNTPQNLFLILSKPPFSEQIPWEKTFVFWGDERAVPANDSRNNARMAKELLLDHVAIPPENIHPIPVDMPPEIAAQAYENQIRDFFKTGEPCFDLILLGLGTNGHTASIFPGYRFVFDTRLMAAVLLPEMARITMMPELINKARHILFLVAGKEKSAILNTVLTAPYQPEKYPAQLVKPDKGSIRWFVDLQAAGLLA